MTLTFTRKVKEAYENYGFESLFIIGPQGLGKTTYAMLVAHEVYGDWDKVLEHLAFNPKPLILKLHEALKSGKRIPLIVFDDAGIHLSKYLWFLDKEGRQIVMLMNSLYNIIRTVCAAVIFTSPDMDTIAELRKKSWWVGEPRLYKDKRDPRRIMTLYKKRILVTGQVVHTKRAIDVYRVDVVPSDVRKQYEEMRREATREILDRLLEALGLGSTPSQEEIEELRARAAAQRDTAAQARLQLLQLMLQWGLTG